MSTTGNGTGLTVNVIKNIMKYTLMCVCSYICLHVAQIMRERKLKHKSHKIPNWACDLKINWLKFKTLAK